MRVVHAYEVTNASQDWDASLVLLCDEGCVREFDHFFGGSVMVPTFYEAATDRGEVAECCDFCGDVLEVVAVTA